MLNKLYELAYVFLILLFTILIALLLTPMGWVVMLIIALIMSA